MVAKFSNIIWTPTDRNDFVIGTNQEKANVIYLLKK